MSCPFAALGLEPTATTDQVKVAYRALARSLHPDLGGCPDEFAKLNENYKDALHIASTRACPTCNGTRTVAHTHGWTTVQMPCPACG